MKKWMKVMSVAVAMLACMSAQIASPAKYDKEVASARPSKETNEDGSPVCGECGGSCGDFCKMQKDTSCCGKKQSAEGGNMDQGTFKEEPRRQSKSAARAAVEGE